MSDDLQKTMPTRPFMPDGLDDPNEYPPDWDYARCKDIIDHYDREARGEVVYDSEYLDLEDPAEEAAERRLDVLNLMNELDQVRDQIELMSPQWDECDQHDATRMAADLRWAVERLREVAGRQTAERVAAERSAQSDVATGAG